MLFIYPLLILFISLLLYFTYITVTFQAAFSTGDGNLVIKYYSWPGFRKQSSFPISLQISKFLNSRKSGRSKKDRSSSRGIVLYSLQHFFLIQEFKWNTILGTGDAMTTALGTGSLWALKGSVIAYLSNLYNIHNFQVNISPDFNGNTSSTELYCIFKIRLVHIILIISYVLMLKIRRCVNGYTAAGKPQPSH